MVHFNTCSSDTRLSVTPISVVAHLVMGEGGVGCGMEEGTGGADNAVGFHF